MKKFILPLLATLTVLLLSACSIISDLIPDQEVELFAESNEAEQVTSDVLSEPPQSLEDFFSGEDTASLATQANGEKYIAINVYRKVTDFEGEQSYWDFAYGLAQDLGVHKVVLSSETPTQFPNEIRASFENPLFLFWDDFVAPEENMWFWFLSQERRNALTASYTNAHARDAAMLLNKDSFRYTRDVFEDGSIVRKFNLADNGIFFTKDETNCSDKQCVYDLNKTKMELCDQLLISGDDYGVRCWTQDQAGFDKVAKLYGAIFGRAFSPNQFLRYSLDRSSIEKILNIATSGSQDNSVSLSVWMKVKSTSDTPIPESVTATSTLFFPPAKVSTGASSSN